MEQLVEKLGAIASRLSPVLTSLKKYEGNFGADAKKTLQDSIIASDKATALTASQRPEPGLAGYLLTGALLQDLKATHAQLQQCLSAILGGAIPVPRSSKEELSNLRTELIALKMDTPIATPQLQALVLLKKLYGKATDSQSDIDVVEAQLDDAVRRLIADVFDGATTLPEQDLHRELLSLQTTIASLKDVSSPSSNEDTAVLGLVVNSLQRLHAAQLQGEESDGAAAEEEEEEEEEEDDEDDPFYMPMMPAAIKMAEASKFMMLAQPLGPAEAKPMIDMGPDEAKAEDESSSGTIVNGELIGLTELDFEPMPEGEAMASPSPQDETVSAAPRASSNGQGEVVDATPRTSFKGQEEAVNVTPRTSHQGQEQAVSTAPRSSHQGQEEAVSAAPRTSHQGQEDVDRSVGDAGPVVGAADDAGGSSGTLAVAAAAAAAAGAMEVSIPATNGDLASPAEGSIASPATGQEVATPPVAGASAAAFIVSPCEVIKATSPRPPDEKLNKFVDFLQGDNPGACMFHAQMRLSLDGCRKLASFVGSSSRVKALSLSHNHIGDDGMKVLCVGLRANRSVTALDLPDNDIGDVGILELSQSLCHNTSLTQLQLAYNRITDSGAQALAEMLKASMSLKKLGLSHNQIGKQGCQALTAAISVNQSLNHLQLLPGNPVQEKDAKALAKALKRNKKFSIRSFLGMDIPV